MLDQSNISGNAFNASGNTYIQFSFEKSLRKYEQQPSKKKRNMHCTNNKNSSMCQHCVSKIYRKNGLLSTDRKGNFQNSRKICQIQSLQKARQFSQSKRNKQLQNSYSRNNQKGCSKIHFSQFISQEESNLNDSNHKEISNFNENISECKKALNFDDFLNPIQNNPNIMQNQLSIEKKLINFNKQVNVNDLLCQQIQLKNQKIIEQQDQSFSLIQLIQPQTDKKSQMLNYDQSKQKKETQINNIQNCNIVSCAYFSSYSSLQSSQSLQKNFNQDQSEQKTLQQENEENKLVFSQTIQDSNMQIQKNDFTQNNTLNILKIESKQQLKKQVRQQYRQRLLSNIKICKALEESCQECFQISQCLKKEIQMLKINSNTNQNNQKQCNQENNVHDSTQECIQNEQQQEKHEQIISNQQLEDKLYQNVSNSQAIQFQDQISLKRRRNFQNQEENVIPFGSIRKKYKKINFQIQQNYQRLGRIKIVGLGRQNQSICLSIRRFSQMSLNGKNDGSIRLDKSKIVNYIISQRPYLQINKEQLMHAVEQIINEKFGKSQDQKLKNRQV